MEIVSIGRKCPECQSDEWSLIDSNDYYHEICTKCGNMKEILKIDYLNNFTCDNCNCFSGTIEENNKFLAIRCKNCGRQHVMLEKHPSTDNRRTPGAVPMQPKTSQRVQQEQQEKNSQPKCPKCGCTNIQVVRKKWGLFSGFFTNDVERVCVKCKKRW